MPIAVQNNNDTFKAYKSEAIKAAKDLGYGTEILEKLENAKTDGEIQRLMIAARHKKFG